MGLAAGRGKPDWATGLRNRIARGEMSLFMLFTADSRPAWYAAHDGKPLDAGRLRGSVGRGDCIRACPRLRPMRFEPG